MWLTEHNIADWVHSKTQILLATLRTQNQLRGDLMYFWKSDICVNRTPSHAYFLAHSFAHMHLHGSRSSVCVSDRTIHIPSMFAHERSSSFSRSHTTPLTLLSSSSTTSSTIISHITLPINKPCAQDPQNEEYGSVAKTTSSTGYEPNVIDNFDYSETYTAIFQNESVDVDTEPSYSFDAELNDELIRKALSSPLFTQNEKIQQTWDKLITLMKKVCYQLSPFSHEQVRGNPCTNQVQTCLKKENQVTKWKTCKSGFSLKDTKSKFLLKWDLRSRSTNFKPSLTEEESRN